jgi:hypothetical protein
MMPSDKRVWTMSVRNVVMRMEMKTVLFSKTLAKRSSLWCPLFEETASAMLSFILIYKFSLDYVVAVVFVAVVFVALVSAVFEESFDKNCQSCCNCKQQSLMDNMRLISKAFYACSLWS